MYIQVLWYPELSVWVWVLHLYWGGDWPLGLRAYSCIHFCLRSCIHCERAKTYLTNFLLNLLQNTPGCIETSKLTVLDIFPFKPFTNTVMASNVCIVSSKQSDIIYAFSLTSFSSNKTARSRTTFAFCNCLTATEVPCINFKGVYIKDNIQKINYSCQQLIVNYCEWFAFLWRFSTFHSYIW